MKTLVDQYKASPSALVKQLDVTFIQHSIERIDEYDRRECIPKTIRACSQDAGQPLAGPMFNVILRLLLDLRIPPRGSKEDKDFRAVVGLSDEADSKYLANMIGIFLRLRIPTGSQTWPQANATLPPEELGILSLDGPETAKLLQRFSELKAKLVTFIASGAFSDDEKFLPALYAASSFDKKVASMAEEIMKRSSVSLEDRTLVERLFHAHSTLPAAYRIRILGLLSRSVISTAMPESILALVQLDFEDHSPGPVVLSELQPSSTLERTKLRIALFQYLSWIARMGPSGKSSTIAPQLIQCMRTFIESQGWPSIEQASQDDIILRSKAYETIGMLSRGADMPVLDRLDLASWLFRSLSEDSSNDVVVNIDGALSSLTANVPPSVGDHEPALQVMLLKYMMLPDEPPAIRSTRHAVVKWANQCLPFSNPTARWIDILAIGGQRNERNDVIEQGHRGLDPWSYFIHNEIRPPLPDWKRIIGLVYCSTASLDAISEDLRRKVALNSPDAVFANFSREQLPAFKTALHYCSQLMFLSALNDYDVTPDLMQKIDARVHTDLGTREQIRAYLRNADRIYVVAYLQACLHGAVLEDVRVSEGCVRCFVEVASLSHDGILGDLDNSWSWELLSLIKSNTKEVRALGAKALGITAPQSGNEMSSLQDLATALHALYDKAPEASGSQLNAAEGAILAIGHLLSRSVYHNRPLSLLELPTSWLLNERIPSSLLDATLDCHSQLWSAKLSVPALDGQNALDKVIARLAKEARKGNEKAICAMGRLAIGLDEMDCNAGPVEHDDDWSQGLVGKVLTELFALHEMKRVEVHFTVGEAITAAVARWDSDNLRLTLDVETRTESFQSRCRSRVMSSLLNKLIRDCKATKPSLLKASGIWLFCLVQYCSHLKEVQSRLREAQSAFMRLLSARDELVQETASRGLSLVYERGDPELKSALVKDLVSSFTRSSTQLKVEEDTELFEPGALPTGEGNSVTSYKDIVNLANEVGDQRLVYKFMSLAANAATWSTRSAFGRFGLSNILSESEVDPKLYPKLYRYRFDPNTNVQRSMDDIWKALVKDQSAVLDTYFDDIMEDLLKSIIGREWRMREASCAAISDLLQSRPFPKYETYYRDIWTAALKVLDDVKGSVREAALRLCMSLSNSLVRQLEEGHNISASNDMMKEAVPFLLSDKGVESSVQDVQAFATVTVMKIAKRGGKSLRPFIPDIVCKLLGLLSTIEPEQINYHYQRAGDDSREKIDRLRTQMVNQSPISEAIENCLRFVNEDVMAELAPRLEGTIKSAIGMPTKIGCSRVLTTLFTRHTDDIKPVSDRLLRLMQKQALDKNDEVSQAYARAAAYIMRVVPDKAKRLFCEHFIEVYYLAEDEFRRQKVADVVLFLSKISPDQFAPQETTLLPFAYLGSHDVDEYTRKVFKEVWNQHAASSRTVLRFIPEIVAFVQRGLDEAQWALRHTGAFAAAGMVSDAVQATEATGEISEGNLRAIWLVLEKSLALKTFSGKEKILDCYPKFVKRGKPLWAEDKQIAAQMKKIAVREAKRNNEEYRPHAFRCLWQFSAAREDLDMLHEIADIVTPYLDELRDVDKMEVDSKKDFTFTTAKNGFEAVARGYGRSNMAAPKVVLDKVLTILQPYLSSSKFQAIKREVWYDCVRDLMTEAANSEPVKHGQAYWTDGGDVWMGYLKSLDMETPEAGTEAHRLKRVKAFSTTLEAMEKAGFDKSDGQTADLRDKVAAALTEERALDVQRAWREVLERL